MLLPETGEILWQRFGVWRSRLDLATVESLELVSDPGGSVGIAMRARGQRSKRRVPVLMNTLYAKRSMEPDTLRRLAAEIAVHVPAHVAGAVPGRLRAQADHVGSGGALEDSPLARR